MSRVKPAEVRFYVDADLLGLARVLAGLRPDVTYPGDPGAVIHKRSRPACPITSPAVKDTQWIPEVAARGWLIITRDRHIQEHRLEIAAVREHRARMVAFPRRPDSTGTRTNKSSHEQQCDHKLPATSRSPTTNQRHAKPAPSRQAPHQIQRRTPACGFNAEPDGHTGRDVWRR